MNTVYTVLYNKTVIWAKRKFKNQSKAEPMMTFGFSTLYTKKPQYQTLKISVRID